MNRIGIDLGGTKIEARLFSRHGTELARERLATPRDPDGTIIAIRDLVVRLESAHGPARVGLAHPGSISPATGLMRNANSVWLNGRPFRDDLSAALDRPVRSANDANCFALSEARDGAGRDGRVIFGVILGTGVGGGVVVNGRLLDGAQGIAGEWGHNPLPWPRQDELAPPACWCGKTGCLESWVSGPGLAADHARRHGGNLAANAIFDAASGGDAAAADSVDRHANRLARGLATIVNILDPDIIVLGGGVSNAPGLCERVSAALPDWIFSDVCRTRIVRHEHGDASGVRGAAWLWPADESGTP
ncbi:transcriptional regulator [Maricaulis sp. W15]|uniref:ROK family protein n=1 Tax=Maricaulis sp. W15 TaxID=1772333 RepID=UPI000948991A|nr:ROK family protein [Maricaulis sp. W15]OLF73137.1 transcriptional regulator [Maricaulis sp. W15]